MIDNREEHDAMEQEVEIVPNKRKRPDKAVALKQRKNYDERVLKTTLKKALHPDYRSILKPILEQRSIELAKAVNRASIIFLRILLSVIENECWDDDSLYFLNDSKTRQRFFYQLMVNKQSPKAQKAREDDDNETSVFPELLQQFNSPEIAALPIAKRFIGDGNSLNYAGSKLYTNFVTSLTYHFGNRQKRYIASWCKLRYLPKETSAALRFAVNGWDMPEKLAPFLFDNHPSITSFIAKERSVLFHNTYVSNVTKEWLKSHLTNTLRYTYHIMKFNQEAGLKKFAISPIGSFGRSFLYVDTTVLWNMLKEANLLFAIFEENVTASQALKPEFRSKMWNAVLQHSKLLTNKQQFGDGFDSDGVSVCIHYKIPRIEKVEGGDKQVMDLSGKRVIAIDPGRVDLIHSVEKEEDGSWKVRKLTRAAYYTLSGNYDRNRKKDHWNKTIKESLEALSKVSLKTIFVEDVGKYLVVYREYYDTIWEQYVQVKWAKMNMEGFIKKAEVVDKFFSEFGKDVVVAYGAAKFNPNSKNELSAPTTTLSRRCARFHKTRMVDEYNTTKLCCCCHQPLTPLIDVFKAGNKVEERQIRGLRWCNSNETITCRKFLSRDLNAAINIYQCFVANKRPVAFDRCQAAVKVPQSLRLCSWLR